MSGVIASAHVVAGQVVDARELLFEIVDPARLRIEALAYDAALAADIGSATLALGGQRVPLAFVGAARSLREQALPLVFRAEGEALSALAVGQPLRIHVQTRSTLKGIAVPVAALLKNPVNQTIVWVKAAPERFEPRVVTVEPLDGVVTGAETVHPHDARHPARGDDEAPPTSCRRGSLSGRDRDRCAMLSGSRGARCACRSERRTWRC